MEPDHSQRSSNRSMDAQAGGKHQSAHDPLNRLRSFRNRPQRNLQIGSDVEFQIQGFKKISKSESAAIEVWNTVAPDHVLEMTSILGFRSGRLKVGVESAAHRHIVDRWLKSGGFREIQSLARVPIQGVRLQISPNVPK